ncbi:MAG: UDP-3-O-(3-hydroxymyristoyl)glucosamine N-acyltransferase [Planctomycetota bacterium]|nr:UDP-3-O-(3-hydroxymyristoyl)glucosamine N-acyltransferase [Planctomycetota bacterium]
MAHHQQMTTKTLAELAVICGATLDGDGERVVSGPASLSDAGPTEISFLANSLYEKLLATTAAAAVIVSSDYESEREDLTLLRCENPNSAFTAVVQAFAGDQSAVDPGVHPSAVIAQSAEVHEEARIGALVSVGEGARIGRNAVLHPGVIVEKEASVGEETVLQAGVQLFRGVTIGARCTLGAGTVVGSDGFGFDPSDAGWIKVAQCGTVNIEDDVDVGANSTIDRARFGSTRICRGAKLDNMVHVGHNALVEEDAMLIAQVGLAGSSRVGRGAILGGKVGVVGHTTVGAGARVAGGAVVWSDVEPGADYAGLPARPKVEFLQTMALSRRLPGLLDRIKALEARIQELEASQGDKT